MLLFVLGAVTAFVALAGVGHEHLDAEVPMRVPWLVVVNLFPIVAALVVVAFPARVLGRAVGYFADSFLATATYILSLAGLIRGARAWRERVAARPVGWE